MKYVNSGGGKMPLITLLAVLSISLTINLPGLAVSPMLGKLHHIFHSSELESQLLTSLPNLFMIPMVIIAGRLATPRRQTAVLITGLLIFLLSGIACFFAHSMTELIIYGCTAGIGCGLVVPIAAGCISEWFTASPRQRDLGLKSTTSNAMVIIANLFVGWVVVYNWHAAFAVYLIPIIPLCLIPFMTQRFVNRHRTVDQTTVAIGPTTSDNDDDHFQGRTSLWMLISLIMLYMILTYATTSISYYSPFLMDHFGMSTTEVGVVTAMYYLMCSFAGAVVGSLKRFFGRPVMFICLALCAAGLIVIGLTHNFWVMAAASFVTGFGYGVIQPIIYNKTTYIAPNRKLGTQYFGYVLSSNYVAIMMVPFVDSFARKLFHSSAPGFEFVFSGAVVIVLLVWALIKRNYYVFDVNPASPAPTAAQVEAADSLD